MLSLAPPNRPLLVSSLPTVMVIGDQGTQYSTVETPTKDAALFFVGFLRDGMFPRQGISLVARRGGRNSIW